VALHIGQRTAATAEPGEIRVSSTVKDLVAGSGIAFSDLGLQRLKGVPEEWRLITVSAP
jgi:class 3 adenylate cyclase